MIKKILVNPFTSALGKYIWGILIELRHRNKKLRLGHLSTAHNCQFGFCNTIYNNVVLTNVQLGDYTYIANKSVITHTTIGKFCSIGPEILCGLGMHPNHFVSTHPAFFSIKKQAQETFTAAPLFEEQKQIHIGNDVWIGARAMILDGVTIGDGAIIAAGAVVAKDVASYAIVGGVPAKLIRYRFSESKIKELLRTAWWNKPTSWIRENAKQFLDVDDFIAALR